MKYSFNAAGVGEALVGTFKIGATVIAGQVVIWDGSADYAEITDASTTGAADAFGVTLGPGTYSTTQGTGASSANVEVEVVYSPLAVYEANIAGSATSGAALATTAPANVLTNTTASAGGTLVTAAEVGTVSFAGGLICGLSGANKNATRVITTHTNSTSNTVTVPFDYALAVNDKFVRVPCGKGVVTVQLTSALDEANGIIVAGTGIPAGVVKVAFDTSSESDPRATVWLTLRDHYLNPLS